jgi:hypothetical protein
VYPWSLHGFPWGTSLSYRGTEWRLWFQFSKCVLCYLICVKPHVTRSVIFNKISVSLYCV